VRIPVIGSGGIASGKDALEFIAVGATAVQVGTATFTEPGAAPRVVEELRAWLAAHGIARIGDLRGRFEAPAAQPDRARA
jgi:dihydroorotate dehydrogenase (NAD+) catalytic subunit